MRSPKLKTPALEHGVKSLSQSKIVLAGSVDQKLLLSPCFRTYFMYAGGSRGSSPDQETGKLGTSPHINKFLAREPPDGCEKVNLKFVEDTR
jgi:hypothetical protein